MEDELIEAFHDVDEDGSGRVTRSQLQVLIEKLGIEGSDHDRLFAALDRNGTGFVTLDSLLDAFLNFSSKGDEDEEVSDEDEENSNNNDPVRGIMSLLPPSKLTSLKTIDFREALEEYIQRRLSLEESKALSRAFEKQRRKNSTFDDVAIGSVLSNWQSLLQGEDDEEEENDDYENSSNTTPEPIVVTEEEEEVTTYEYYFIHS